MRIVTASDDRYFDSLLRLVTSAKEHMDITPDVFDLGMTDVQIDALNMMGVDVFPVTQNLRPGNGYPGRYRPRALHKPAMLYQYFFAAQDDFVYMDADAYVVQPFDFPTTSIGVSKVDKVVMNAYSGSNMRDYVGPYHSGIIFLAYVPKTMDFLDEWGKDLRNDPLPSDKKSLNRVLPNYKHNVLDANEFNSKVLLPYTKIFHNQGPIAR